MQNVYESMSLFYKNKPKGTPFLFPKDIAERFLRRNAWKGADDDELKHQWHALSLLLTVAAEWKLDSWDFVSIGDYREMFRRFIASRKHLKTPELVAELDFFFNVLECFCKFYEKDAEYLLERLTEARESFFAANMFLLPKPQEKDDFYSVLEHKDMLQPEDMQQLNECLDTLLNTLGDYYHTGKYLVDFTRAIVMYGGQDFDPQDTADSQEREDFFYGFWDYFLFDYHLLDSDLNPLENYYKHEHNRLSFTDASILRDLLKARFTVFSIESVDGDVVICRDIFTDENLELPVPESYITDYRKTIFMGHVHSGGVMLLNYITTIPASHKLQERIKREVMRQYELFRYQQPEAGLEDFFLREAASVRQLIRIMTEYAQLNVLPFRQYPEPVERDSHPLPEGFDTVAKVLDDMGRASGIGVYSRSLLKGLYIDYCILGSDTPETMKSPIALAAIFYVFMIVNGMQPKDARRFINRLKHPWEKIKQIADSIYNTLKCIPFDPRYLTEDSFVQMLYAER